MEIWKFANHASAHLPGTFAGRLALYALSQGLKPEVLEDRKKLDRALQLQPSRLFPDLDIAAALKEHEEYLHLAEESGILVHHADLTLAEIARQAVATKVLMIVSTSVELAGLHWVLVRDYNAQNQTIVVMDPGTGLNYEASLAVFLNHYENIHPFMGVAVVLKRGSEN